ncbi:MAG TPA: hypothetical protein VLH09_02295 [Bryobacteraceae bacterium]|nr:hypothetical protein [Bryobacteraceae bacterium]
MPSFCPKCHKVLEEDEICCAQVRYTWRCKDCHKLTSGIALPYGRCFLCGGELQVLEDRKLGDPMELRAIQEALQFELDAFHFYRMARERIQNPQNRIILEQLYEHEVDHLHELEEKYHAHLDPSVINLDPGAEKLLSEWLFRDIVFADDTAAPRVYAMAIEMERRTRDHFRKAAAEAAEGSPERQIYLELAAEEEEHVALLEAEMEQFK